jgi:hypothetical protein
MRTIAQHHEPPRTLYDLALVEPARHIEAIIAIDHDLDAAAFAAIPEQHDRVATPVPMPPLCRFCRRWRKASFCAGRRELASSFCIIRIGKLGTLTTGEHVVSAKEFREYADECLGWAKTAKSDKERRTFLQMAQAWLEAADLLETKPPAADLPTKPGSGAPLSGDAT